MKSLRGSVWKGSAERSGRGVDINPEFTEDSATNPNSSGLGINATKSAFSSFGKYSEFINKQIKPDCA